MEFFSETVVEQSGFVEFLEYLEFSQVWIITLGEISGICGILEFFSETVLEQSEYVEFLEYLEFSQV